MKQDDEYIVPSADELVQTVIDKTMEMGGHPTSIMMVGSNNAVVSMLDNNPESYRDKCLAGFHYGMMFALERGDIGELVRVMWISHATISALLVDPKDIPEGDERQELLDRVVKAMTDKDLDGAADVGDLKMVDTEVLLISCREPGGVQRTWIYEYLRDPDGSLRDLANASSRFLPDSATDEEVDALSQAREVGGMMPVLGSIIAGWNTGGEMYRMMHPTVGEDGKIE